MSRREDHRLTTGHGRYTADWNLPDQLHAVFLRADRAHAEIVSLNASRALAHAGVKAVLTGEDARAAGFKSMPNVVNYTGKGGQPMQKPGAPRHSSPSMAFATPFTRRATTQPSRAKASCRTRSPIARCA